MGKGAKAPSVSIPEYQDPTYKTFSSNTGSTNYTNGQFGYTPNTANQDFQTQLDATRSAILKSMGGTDQATNDSLNNWQKTYFDESNRLTAPALSNGLFNRGLGGSNYYAGSMNDLLTKNANNAVLGKYQLQNQDFNQNQTAFTNVNNAEGALNDQSNKMLGMQSDFAKNQDNNNLDLYKATLPYLATRTNGTQGQGFGGLIGGALGGAAGFALGGPGGAVMGAQLGSGAGGGVDASQGYGSYGSQVYQPTLNTLSMMNLPGASVAPTGAQVGAFGGGASTYAPAHGSAYNNSLAGLNSQFSYLR